MLAASLIEILQFFKKGGFFMIPLIACSVVAVTVIILRGLALRRHLVIPMDLANHIEHLQPTDSPDSIAHLAQLMSSDDSTLARIAQVGLANLDHPKDENLNSVQTVARHEVGQLDHGLHVLEIVIGIAPLLGLLGAVSGLVTVFGAFGSNANQSDPHAIAKGISEALTTTVVGIGIAIPTLIAHGLLAKRVETLAADLELLISGLLTKCYHQQRSQGGYQYLKEEE